MEKPGAQIQLAQFWPGTRKHENRWQAIRLGKNMTKTTGWVWNRTVFHRSVIMICAHLT
jgi:hypothetical protein